MSEKDGQTCKIICYNNLQLDEFKDIEGRAFAHVQSYEL